MKLVIDSNVWISALVFGGNPRRIFEYAVANGVIIVLSDEIVSETRRILRHKFPNFLEDYEALLVVLKRQIKQVVPKGKPITVARDPNDNYILEAAVEGHVAVVISGDKDLLVLNSYQKIHIYAPADFLSEHTNNV